MARQVTYFWLFRRLLCFLGASVNLSAPPPACFARNRLATLSISLAAAATSPAGRKWPAIHPSTYCRTAAAKSRLRNARTSAQSVDLKRIMRSRRTLVACMQRRSKRSASRQSWFRNAVVTSMCDRRSAFRVPIKFVIARKFSSPFSPSPRRTANIVSTFRERWPWRRQASLTTRSI